MKVISLADAERRLRDVRSVALGGMLLENRPSTLVRALLRAGTADLFLCSAPAASSDADVLLGAGRVGRGGLGPPPTPPRGPAVPARRHPPGGRGGHGRLRGLRRGAAAR